MTLGSFCLQQCFFVQFWERIPQDPAVTGCLQGQWISEGKKIAWVSGPLGQKRKKNLCLCVLCHEFICGHFFTKAGICLNTIPYLNWSVSVSKTESTLGTVCLIGKRHIILHINQIFIQILIHQCKPGLKKKHSYTYALKPIRFFWIYYVEAL